MTNKTWDSLSKIHERAMEEMQNKFELEKKEILDSIEERHDKFGGEVADILERISANDNIEVNEGNNDAAFESMNKTLDKLLGK